MRRAGVEAVALAAVWLAACAPLHPGSAPGPAATLPDGSVYAGSYRDGVFHGEGRLTYPSGAVYEGPFENGSLHGRGRAVEADGSVYEGEFERGMRQGRGRLEEPSGSRYEGEFRANSPDGRGTYTFANGMTYEGEFRHGDFEGKGTFHYPDGTVYTGDLVHNLFSGLGTLRQPDGTVYEGEFRNDLFEGRGVLTQAGGGRYEGQFAHGEFHGQGTFTTADGDVFEGEFRDGEFTGRGTYRGENGTVYTGEFVDGDFSGQGVLVRPDGYEYTGGFADDQFQGQGRLVRPDGSVYEGGFEAGKLHGRGVLTWQTAAGEARVAHGEWEEGRYVRGDADELLAPPPVDTEALLYRQPERLAAALARVEASRPGVPDVYYVGFASWGPQKVFANEVLLAQAAFEESLGARGRTLILTNDRRTHDQAPLATVTNLERALVGIAERMDLDEDILFLLLTSHGSQEHGVGVALDGVRLNQLSPQRLGSILDGAGIRWRVLVVSACYSGGFVEPLESERTLVITASAPDRTSFGCSDDAELTYFGQAFLRDQLAAAPSLPEAFARARERIREMEAEQGLDHSDPQIASAKPIERQLAAWRSWLARHPSPPATAAASPAP